MERDKQLIQMGGEPPLFGGRYTLECALGEGGMGTVWRALDSRTQRHVAIKQLHCRGPEATRRLTREVHALARLRHPNLVDVLDSGTTDDDSPYLVMEFVLGKTLREELVDPNRLPVQRTCHIAGQVARALAAAHAEGVVHRDLKPSNIMLSELYGEHDVVKLVDFGVAHVIDSTQASLGTAHFVGTPNYASPEQAKGEETTPRSDLYSLGVVVYEMLTGRLPFLAETAMGVLFHHVNSLPQPPRQLERAVPDWLDALVLALLQKEANRRPESAREVLACLQRWRPTDAYATTETSLDARPTVSKPPAESSPRVAIEVLPGTVGTGTSEPISPSALGLTRPEHFVGRQLEQERLRRVLERAIMGAGGVVLISGDAGIGKTMLVQRLPSIARAAGHAVFVASGRCLDLAGASEPYLPFLHAVGEWLTGIDAERGCTLLRRHAPTWCLQFPSVFGSDETLDQLRRETHGATRERMLREFADVLAAAAGERCVLLLLEDLHWADPSSIDQIRLLCQRSQRQRWLVAGTLRSEGLAEQNPALDKLRTDLRAMAHCEEVILAGLTQEHIAAYLQARFPAHALPGSFLTTLTTRTEGQPLFVTRLLDLLVERGDLQEQGGIWRLARPASELALEVPVSVSSVIQRKLESLAVQDRRTLQYASVEGAEFTSSVLAELVGEEELVLGERLSRLEKSHGLIVQLQEDEPSPGHFVTRYRFSHALYKDHVYAELTGGRRRELHRRTAEALLRQQFASSAPLAALALHFESAGDAVQASKYLLRAGEEAERSFANQEASQLYARAAELLRSPGPAGHPAHYCRLYEKLGWNAYEFRDFERAEGAFQSLLKHAEAVADVEAELEGLHGLCLCAIRLGRYETLPPRLEQGLKLAIRTDNHAGKSEMSALRAYSEQISGRLDTAALLLDESMPLAWKLNHSRALHICVPMRAYLHDWHAEYAESEAMYRRALALDLKPRVAINCTFARGFVLSKLGRVSDALSEIGRAVNMARRESQNHILLQTYEIETGSIYREVCNFDLAIELHQRLLERIRKQEGLDANLDPGLRAALPCCLTALGHDYLRAERGDEARIAFAQAEQHLHQSTTKVTDKWWLELDLFLGQLELQIREGPLESLRLRAAQLVDRARESGDRVDQVRARLILARLERGLGQVGEARQQIDAALVLLRDHPMPLIAWRVHAQLGELLAAANGDEAQRGFSDSANAIAEIAHNIDDLGVRQIFLESRDVREVLSRYAAGVAGPTLTVPA